MVTRRYLLLAGAFLGVAACKEAASPAASARATLSLVQTSSSVLSAVTSDDSAPPAPPGLIRATLVDSLIVTISSVAVHPRMVGPDSLFPDSMKDGDSCRALGPGGPFDPNGPGGRGGPGGFGPRGPGGFGPRGPGGPGMKEGFGPPGAPDSLKPMNDWYTLDVVSGGRVDLMHLPVVGQSGIVVASGSVAAGEYRGAALMIDSGTIWLKSPVVTPSGDTLKAGVGIPVQFPPMGVMVPADVTVPAAGGDFTIVFDVSQTFGAAMVTPDGKVILAPVMRHGPPPPR